MNTQDLSSLPDTVIQHVKLHVANQLPKLCTSKMKHMGCISVLPLLNEDEAHIDENSPWQIALKSTGSKEHKGLTLLKGDFFPCSGFREKGSLFLIFFHLDFVLV